MKSEKRSSYEIMILNVFEKLLYFIIDFTLYYCQHHQYLYKPHQAQLVSEITSIYKYVSRRISNISTRQIKDAIEMMITGVMSFLGICVVVTSILPFGIQVNVSTIDLESVLKKSNVSARIILLLLEKLLHLNQLMNIRFRITSCGQKSLDAILRLNSETILKIELWLYNKNSIRIDKSRESQIYFI